MHGKVILVFEGIDHFIDLESKDEIKEAPVAFWLPRFFPKRVKVIVTADKNSEALSYFKKMNCDIAYI